MSEERGFEIAEPQKMSAGFVFCYQNSEGADFYPFSDEAFFFMLWFNSDIQFQGFKSNSTLRYNTSTVHLGRIKLYIGWSLHAFDPTLRASFGLDCQWAKHLCIKGAVSMEETWTGLMWKNSWYELWAHLAPNEPSQQKLIWLYLMSTAVHVCYFVPKTNHAGLKQTKDSNAMSMFLINNPGVKLD